MVGWPGTGYSRTPRVLNCHKGSLPATGRVFNVRPLIWWHFIKINNFTHSSILVDEHVPYCSALLKNKIIVNCTKVKSKLHILELDFHSKFTLFKVVVHAIFNKNSLQTRKQRHSGKSCSDFNGWPDTIIIKICHVTCN